MVVSIRLTPTQPPVVECPKGVSKPPGRNNMKNINIILSGLTALLGLLVGIAPYTFAKVCGMASMHCHKVTAPTVLVFGILIFVISAVQTVILWKKR